MLIILLSDTECLHVTYCRGSVPTQGSYKAHLMLSFPIFTVGGSGNAKCLESKGLQHLVYVYKDSTSFSDLLTFVISLTNEDLLDPYMKYESFQFQYEPLLGCCIIICCSAILCFLQEKIISALKLVSLGSFLIEYEQYICLYFTAFSFRGLIRIQLTMPI